MEKVIEILKKYNLEEKVLSVGRCARFSEMKKELTNKELVLDIAQSYIEWLLGTDKMTDEETEVILKKAFELLTIEVIKAMGIDVNKVDEEHMTKEEKAKSAARLILAILNN